MYIDYSCRKVDPLKPPVIYFSEHFVFLSLISSISKQRRTLVCPISTGQIHRMAWSHAITVLYANEVTKFTEDVRKQTTRCVGFVRQEHLMTSGVEPAKSAAFVNEDNTEADDVKAHGI